MSESSAPARRRVVAAAIACALIAGACSRSAPPEPTPAAASATPRAVDVTLELVSAEADTKAITARAEQITRAAFAQREPPASPERLAWPGVSVIAMRCAEPAGTAADCWKPATYPVLGQLTVRVTPIDAVTDYERAGHLARALARGTPESTDPRTTLAITRIHVLLGRAYEEAELESALAGGRDDDAATHRRNALARYQSAIALTKDLHGADEARRSLWSGAAWAGRARLEETADAAHHRATAESLLQAARKTGQGATWELATMELATLLARSSPPQLDAAKALFEEALSRAPNLSPLVRVAYAAEVACRKGDGALHGRLLAEKAQTWSDPDPLRQWEIAMAKALARRAGTQERWKRCRDGQQ